MTDLSEYFNDAGGLLKQALDVSISLNERTLAADSVTYISLVVSLKVGMVSTLSVNVPSLSSRDIAASPNISPLAVVSPSAKIGKGVRIGAFSIIGPHVVLGDNVTIHEHVVIKGRSELAASCEVYPFTTIGLKSQDKKSVRDFDGLVSIGAGSIVREHVSIHAPSAPSGKTVIGERTLIMGQSHVAHDVVIGNDVVVVQFVALGGHVTIEDNAIIGARATIHQRVRIGAYAMIGATIKVARDVIPFALADGPGCVIRGVNAVGLRRHGFTNQQYYAIKNAYDILFRQQRLLGDALDELRRQPDENLLAIANFVEASSRGITMATI